MERILNYILTKIKSSLAKLLPTKRVICNCEGDAYLVRWYLLRTKRLGIFLHKFIRSDEERGLHDHPWNWIVIPIWRGYWEHRNTNWRSKRVYPILGIRYRPATYQHRVELLRRDVSDHTQMILESFSGKKPNLDLPAWSIFIRFSRQREWGFQMPEGWISHKQFEAEHCE